MCKLAASGAVRYLAPYYLLLMMGLLRSASQVLVVKQSWWRACALVAMTLAAFLIILSPARPLWPAGWFWQHFGGQMQNSRLCMRALAVYTVYGDRGDAFAPAVAILPADVSVLGLITDDDPEASLWHPLGARRIRHVLVNDSGESVRRRGIKYVLVKVQLLREPWDQWLRRMNARMLAAVNLRLRAAGEPSVWRLVELEPAPAAIPASL
jgi:hypothetical protein